MSRSTKKGPFIDPKLLKKVEAVQRDERAHGDPHLVARLDDHAGDGRPDDRRARRPPARAGLRDGEHGRPQAGRVRADAALPRPHSASRRRRRSAAGPTAAAGRGIRWKSARRQGTCPCRPRKVRLVLDQLPGKRIDEALAMLRYLPTPHARLVAKIAAVGGGERGEQLRAGRGRPARQARVRGRGTTLKRFRARARGRVAPILTSHESHHGRRRGEASMGHKVHPTGFRVGIIYDWQSKWFAGQELHRAAARGPRRSAS